MQTLRQQLLNERAAAERRIAVLEEEEATAHGIQQRRYEGGTSELTRQCATAHAAPL